MLCPALLCTLPGNLGQQQKRGRGSSSLRWWVTQKKVPCLRAGLSARPFIAGCMRNYTLNVTPSNPLQRQQLPGEAQQLAVVHTSPFGGSGSPGLVSVWVASACLCVWESEAGIGSLCYVVLLPLDVRKRLSAGKEEDTAEGMYSIRSIGRAFLTCCPKTALLSVLAPRRE